jgi:hypothetical protein
MEAPARRRQHAHFARAHIIDVTVLLFGLLALARKLIILDLTSTTACRSSPPGEWCGRSA